MTLRGIDDLFAIIAENRLDFVLGGLVTGDDDAVY
jgi:hypothetical protein